MTDDKELKLPDLSNFKDGRMGLKYTRPAFTLAYLLWQLKLQRFGVQDAGDFVLGLDLSHWNTGFSLNPQWWVDRWDEGYRFAVLKVTEGTWHEDTVWKQHVDLALDHGYEIGFYHYARNSADGISQARFMVDTVATHIDPVKAKIGYHYDLESADGYSASTMNIRAEQFLRTIDDEFDLVPWMYSAAWFLDQFYPTLDPAVNYLRWVANYTTASDPYLPKIWRDHIEYHSWQFSGSVFDKNRMKKDIWDLLVDDDEEPPVEPPDPPDPELERRVTVLESKTAGLEVTTSALEAWGREIDYQG